MNNRVIYLEPDSVLIESVIFEFDTFAITSLARAALCRAFGMNAGRPSSAKPHAKEAVFHAPAGGTVRILEMG